MVALVVLSCLAAAVPASQGRRVADAVIAGDPASEREHEYAGEDVSRGVAEGRSCRDVRGWLRYSLAIFEDDTQVTIGLTFRGTGGRRVAFELLVDDRVVLARPLVSPTSALVRVNADLPPALTRGRRIICVTLRGVEGLAPALVAVEAVQEHLEAPAEVP
jgi:hypothetical protein